MPCIISSGLKNDTKMDLTTITQGEETTWTQQFTAIYGSYKWLNGVPIHYFTTSISALNLHNDVRLMGEIVGVEKWGFEALFQRVVRKEWVDQMAAGYLGDQNRFKFFPPVTIALLPCQDDMPLRDYGGKEFEFEADGSGFKCSLDGLEIKLPFSKEPEFSKFGTPTQLKWDRQKFAALAIDGQHRISALRQFIPRSSQTAATRDVPATILVFDTHLPNGRDLIQATREIFIDINKNAKTVDASRLILLDDRNFYNGLTRKMILRAYEDGENPSTIEYDSDDENAVLKVTAGIPQELIDTAAGKDATDVGKLKEWQFTSAFILNKSLQHFVFENSFRKVEEFLDASSFKEDSEEAYEQALARRRGALDDDEDPITDKDDLTFEPAVTVKLIERAMSRYRALLLGAFTAFKPYKEHILRFKKEVEAEGGEKLRSILLSEGSLPKNNPIENFTSKAWANLGEAERSAFGRRIRSIYRPSGWSNSIVWYSVFQRGLLYQPMMLRRCLAEGRGEDYGSRQEFAADFIRVINELDEMGIFDREAEMGGFRVWEGVVLKLGDKGSLALDGGDTAAKRCGNLLRLLIGSFLSGEETRFDEFSKCFQRKQGVKGPFSSVCDGYAKLAKVRDAASGAVREDDEYKAEAKSQLEVVLKVVSEIEKI